MRTTAIESVVSNNQRREDLAVRHFEIRPVWNRFFAIACTLLCIFLGCHANAQVNGIGDRPYLGWSTFSQQTINGSFLTQANIIAQSDAMKSSGLEAHGFRYINLDS